MQSELELIEKLLKYFHLNVIERKLLPGGVIKISIIKEFISNELRKHGWFPREFRPQDSFNGGLLELCSTGKIILYKKAEISLANFQFVGKEEYFFLDEAVIAFIKFTYGQVVDGIPIDYNL